MIHLKLMLMSNQKVRLFTERERERREPILGEKKRWKTTEKTAAN